MKKIAGELMTIDLPVIAGGIGAGLIKNLSKKISSNEKIQAAAPLVLGIVLRRMKSPEIKYVGLGMIAVGGRDLAGAFIPAIKGIEDMDLNGVLNGVLNDDVADPLSDEIARNFPPEEMSDDVNDDVTGGVLNDDVSDDMNGDPNTYNYMSGEEY